MCRVWYLIPICDDFGDDDNDGDDDDRIALLNISIWDVSVCANVVVSGISFSCLCMFGVCIHNVAVA